MAATWTALLATWANKAISIARMNAYFSLTGNLQYLKEPADSIRSGATGSIADDGVYSFTAPHDTGRLELIGASSSGISAYFAVVDYETSTPWTRAVTVGTDVNVTTGVLAGTTGSDAKVTISAHSDGKIYIENRSGGAGGWRWVIIGYYGDLV